MNGLSEASTESRPARPAPRVTPTSCIDLDRFCESCGYNLRTLPVHRDVGTGIPVVRCTECGRFQPANDASTALRPWLARVTSVLLVFWMLTLVAGVILAGMAEAGLSYATLEELTVPGGSQIQRIGNITTIRTWSSNFGPRELRTDDPDYELFITLILLCSFTMAFASGLFAVVAFAHWRRYAYVGLVLGMPVIAGGIIALVWNHEAPHLFDWGLAYMASHVGVQVLGGMAGITFGRPVARLAVQILLPSGVRPRLAYLWLADGRPFPRA